MRDPYGFSRDDRLETTGNRGRPIRERAPEESASPSEGTREANEPGEEIASPGAGTLPEEDASTSAGGADEDVIVAEEPAPTQEPIAMSVDLSTLIDHAEAYEFVYYPGDTVEYEVSLTNPYETELTLRVTATIEYMDNMWVYNPEVGTYQRRNSVGEPVEGESTETWDSVTIAPGETLVLSDVYEMPEDATWANYQIHVALTDISSGSTYEDPEAGWFDPPLDLAEVHRRNR
ncbi:MAG: hypothetical protein HY598_05515 [Candidatus Omnitrophica bacterium]|nr:hypothetical protein [Candidatus Omnitrophota bacterium]